MRRNWILGVIVLALACAMTAGDAMAQRNRQRGGDGPCQDGTRERPDGERPGPGDVDPAEVAKRCVERATRMAEGCAKRNATAAENCVAEIEELLDAGQIEEAENVASHCARRINRGTDRCLRMIRTSCDRCVRVLTHLEATDLVDRVKNACRGAAQSADESRDAALAAIRGAFPRGE